MKIRIISLILLVGGVFAVGKYYLKNKDEASFAQNISSTDSIGEVKVGGPFNLTDQHGTLRKDSDFKGKFMLVYFGYTFCPDLCPMALETISLSLKNLGRDRDKIATIFITVDPERDTQEVLHTYATNFDPSILMLRGSKKDIKEVMYHYGVFARNSKEEGMSDYLVDHSTLIYLMGPEGKFIHHFNHTVTPEHLTQVLTKALVDQTKKKIK